MENVTFEYKEPNYETILKRELFDEENMKYLLSDERFNKQDRMKLSNYNKHRTSGSKLTASYKFGEGCEEHKLGRLFPHDSIGLQSFRFDMRNPLAQKYYWDTDIENCHYVIALYQAKLHNVKYEYIERYVKNREECLKLVSENRKKSKTEFLKTLYLGNIKLYSESYTEVEGDITPQGLEFIKNLSKEVETLAIVLWDKNPALHKIKTGKEKKAMNKKSNPKASLMSLLFQTEERKMLMVWDAYLTFTNRYMGVFIHDGGYVEKLEKETIFPQELLIEGAMNIKQYLEYEVKITMKDITYEWTPYKPQLNQYDVMKMEFEKHTFVVGTQIYHIMDDGETEILKYNDAKFKFAPLKVDVWNNEKSKVETKSFLEMWKDDKNRLEYDRVDFFPDLKSCPQKVYNLFKGFEAEQYRPDKELTKVEILQLIQPLIKHCDYLTKGYSRYLMRWFAHIVQHPDKKTEMAILIRDEGDLLTEGGGTGKNFLIDYFGNEILGEKYYIVIGDNKELYSNFNSLMEGKLLVFVEEACSKDNHTNNDLLKSKITSKKININKKMVAQYTVNDYSNTIFTSNNPNPLPIKQGNRRFWVFDTNPAMRGNETYFTQLKSHMNKEIVKWAFYQYLLNYDTYESPVKFSANTPITEAYKDIRLRNAPVFLKWLVCKIKQGKLHDEFTTKLYSEFTKWVTDNKEKTGDFVMTQTAFGLQLTNTKSLHREPTDYEINEETVNKVKRNGTMYLMWNKEAVINGLKKLYLLEETFRYIDEAKKDDDDTDGDYFDETDNESENS